MVPITTLTALAYSLALSPPQSPQPAEATVADGELVRAEVIRAEVDVVTLVGYDADDNVVADVAISAEGIQASIDGVFVDALVTADGSLDVHCHGACTEAERAAAAARIATIALVVDDNTPHAAKKETAGMWCAMSIAAGAAACAGSSLLLCGVGFAAAACACMEEVVIGGEDICD